MNKDWKQEYQATGNEFFVDKINDIMKKEPNNWRNDLGDIGLTWVDDDQNEEEIKAEQCAVAQNVNQEYLVAYFESHVKFKNALINIFIQEMEANNPNYSLFRRYFKAGTPQLLQLLTTGLSGLPTNQTLLLGLVYFHEYSNLLSKVISAYIKACKIEQNLDQFKQLSNDFYISTQPDGYDALIELKSIFKTEKNKLTVLEKIEKSMIISNETVHF